MANGGQVDLPLRQTFRPEVRPRGPGQWHDFNSPSLPRFAGTDRSGDGGAQLTVCGWEITRSHRSCHLRLLNETGHDRSVRSSEWPTHADDHGGPSALAASWRVVRPGVVKGRVLQTHVERIAGAVRGERGGVRGADVVPTVA